VAASTILAALSLAACTAAPATPSPTPTPTATQTDPGSLIGQVIDPIDTTWSGTDSAGDLSVFTLHNDHSVQVTYSTNTFDEPGDTWTVKAGVLTLDIHIDAVNGDLEYTGQYDATAKTIAAAGTTTLSAKTVTVTLSQQ
jgi:hypothetical protein